MIDQSTKPRWAFGVGLFAGLFGIISIVSGGSVLFGGGAVRDVAGDYVPFVVWSNFLAGFGYVAVAIGLRQWLAWVTPVVIFVAALTIATSFALGIHIAMGGEYEVRTIGAMALRSLFWLSVALAVRGKFNTN
ncbi:MAG: hypothetical protein HOH04_16785 [Rhodospirillaceae bacterium]|jgi:hypothetical protein|nr:hypothetical protein [Rhodospirillaceae bacterium]